MKKAHDAMRMAAGLIALACTLAAWAATDVATLLPADTGIYIGWSGKDPNEARLAKIGPALQQIDAFMKEQGEELPPPFRLLPELLPKLASCDGGIALIDLRSRGEDEEPELQAAVVLAGEQAPALADFADQLARDSGAAIAEQPIGGIDFKQVQLGSESVLWARQKDRFVLAWNQSAAEKVAASLSGKGPALAATEEFQFQRKKAGADTPSFALYVNPPRVMEVVKAIVRMEAGELPPVADKVMEELGINAVRSKYMGVTRSDAGPRWQAFAHIEGPYKGLLKIWDQKPLTEDDLKVIPRDAYWAYATNLDLRGLWDEAVRVADAIDPNLASTMQEAVAASAAFVGFSVTDDLLTNFGDTWALYDAPSHGGLLATGTVLVVDVKDTDKLQGMLTRLVQMSGALIAQAAQEEHHKSPVRVEVQQTKHAGHTVYYVQIGGLPVPVAPAWGFVDGRWVFGLWPQSVAAALREGDPQTRGETLLDHPALKTARAQLPKDAQALSYIDMQYFARLLFPVQNAFQTLVASQLKLPINLADMPPVTEAVANVPVSVGVTVRDTDGIRLVSIGGGNLMTVAAAASLGASIALPSLAAARETARETQSMANLRQIAMACIMYATEHDNQLPPNLQILTKEQSLPPDVLRSPVDGTEYIYTCSGVDLNKIANPAKTVLAYQTLKGTHGLVAFTDGHVEKVSLEEFRRLLRGAEKSGPAGERQRGSEE